MSRILFGLLALSAASLAGAQTIDVDVPGVKLRADGAGGVRVDSPNAEVKINGRTVQAAKAGTVVTKGGTTTISNGAVVNLATGGGRSVQVINGHPTSAGESVIIDGSVVNAAGLGGRAEQTIGGTRTVVEGTPLAASKSSKSFVNAELADRDFSGRDLAGADFTNATLTRVDFRGANLSRANFTNAELVDCLLDGATITDAKLVNTTFENTALDKAIR